jgi:hypothetical protein
VRCSAGWQAKDAQSSIDVALQGWESCAGRQPLICDGRICCEPKSYDDEDLERICYELECYDDDSSSRRGSLLRPTLLRQQLEGRVQVREGDLSRCVDLTTLCAAT